MPGWRRSAAIILPEGLTVDIRGRCIYDAGPNGCSWHPSPTRIGNSRMPLAPEARPVVAGSANCLIVDDEPSVRRSLVRMLAAQGFTCLEAASGREGLQVLDRTGEIPLIISDMRMPELDGMGFLEAVRQRFPDSSVIMLSGMSETTTAVDCLHLGAADFLLKPISLSEL